MTDLKSKMERAKRSETFKGKSGSETSPAKKSQSSRTSRPKAKPTPAPVDPAPAEEAMTANERARAAAGIEPKPSRTAAQRQADRRRTFAQLSVEISADGKAELLAAAAANGRTLKAEVLHRLGVE